MKTGLIYGVLAAALIAMVASTIVREPYRTPGEDRRDRHERFSKVGNAGDESAEAQTKAEQYAQARTAPGVVLPGAYSAAFASLAGLPATSGSWTEVTSRPYNADDPRYRDPFASNSGAGNGFAAGRIVGLALAGGAT